MNLAAFDEKLLVMIVGPAAIGKSTIMKAATDINGNFGYVRGFTTRPRREQGDLYLHVDEQQVEEFREEGSLLTHFVHPTTGYHYGTRLDDYAARYNLLDTLSGAVDSYRKLPFRATITIGLVTEASRWQEWFLGRYPHKNQEADKRLAEAKLSLGWLLQQQDLVWLTNTGSPQEVATKLVDIVLYDGFGDQKGRQQAVDCLKMIDKMYD